MRRWVIVGAVMGALGPVVVSVLVSIHVDLPTPLLLSLFPFSIGLLGNEGLPAVMQWSRYGLCLLLNVILYTALGACVGFVMKVLKRKKFG